MARKPAKLRRRRPRKSVADQPVQVVRPHLRRAHGFMLTCAVRKCLIDAAGEGMPRKYCAAMAGVAESTLRNWVARGMANLSDIDAAADGGDPAELDDYGALALDLQQAEAVYRAKLVRRIDKAGLEDWKANSWLLEALSPKDFGKGLKLDVVATTEDGDEISAADRILELIEQGEAREAAAAGDDAGDSPQE